MTSQDEIRKRQDMEKKSLTDHYESAAMKQMDNLAAVIEVHRGFLFT